MSTSSIPSAQSGNVLLSRLPKNQFKHLCDLLELVHLPARTIIYKSHSPIHYVYFPISCVASEILVMKDGRAIEVATIGNEGVIGLAVFVGADMSTHKVVAQVGGHSFRMRADKFVAAANQGDAFRKTLIRYHIAFTMQVSQTVACNGLHPVAKRCCRWLLMTEDRLGTSTLPLTHEFLAIMLGVRRATVSEVLQPIQERRLIKSGRGIIEILDRPGLEALACECYRTIKQEYARIFS